MFPVETTSSEFHKNMYFFKFHSKKKKRFKFLLWLIIKEKRGRGELADRKVTDINIQKQVFDITFKLFELSKKRFENLSYKEIS